MSVPDIETTILNTWDDMKAFRTYVESLDAPIMAIDVETDSVNERKANLYGVGLCFEGHEAFYIPFKNKMGADWWSQEKALRISEWIFYLCQTHKVIGHNVIYDTLVLQNQLGWDITPYIYSDTILQKHAIDEERPFGLKEVAVKYLGAWADKAQTALYDNIKANGGTTTKDNCQMFKADTEILGEYCAYDVILTRQLFDIFEARIEAEGLSDLFYKDEIMPLYKEVTIPMKQRGFNIDVPYFEDLHRHITKDIDVLKAKVLKDIEFETKEFAQHVLDKDYPVKTKGHFPKYVAQLLHFEGAITKAALKKHTPTEQLHKDFMEWLSTETAPESLTHYLKDAQVLWWKQSNPEETSIFNLNSNNHLKWLFFDKLGFTPLSTTETGQPQVDDDFIDSIKSDIPWIQDLLDYKKLCKMKSTYIEGILESATDGIVYSSYIQFGPPSGRYASRNPNIQNLPRVKEDDSGLSELVLKYVNSIKKGFIAPEGYLLVNADYSQLEPMAFSEACGDEKLQDIFKKGHDLYSSIAINVWNLSDCSADKKDKNFLKNLYPEYRQKAKIIALAVVYGAEAGRISKLMNISYDEANEIINNYLDAYPGLKSFMDNCDRSVCENGYVKTKFGRIRHLPEAKRLFKNFGMKLLDRKWAKAKGLEELRWKFKNSLNLAKNFPIQGVAAHVVNRAAVAANRQFHLLGLDAQIIAQVHDELTCISRQDQAEQVKQVLKSCMENTTKIAVPLRAEPLIARSWDEAK